MQDKQNLTQLADSPDSALFSTADEEPQKTSAFVQDLQSELETLDQTPHLHDAAKGVSVLLLIFILGTFFIVLGESFNWLNTAFKNYLIQHFSINDEVTRVALETSL